MGIVGPQGPRNASTSHCDRIDDKTAEEVEKNNSQSGNVDSGYHSFTTVPPRLCSNPPNMITSLGHEDDFTPSYMGYPLSDLGSGNTSNVPYNNFFNNKNGVRTVSKMSPLPPSDLNMVSVATTVPKSCLNQQRAEDEAKELAERIQFCLKLGYSTNQIKVTLHRIGYNASKNDLLKALGDFTSEVSVLTTYSEEPSASNGNPELVPRGPSTVEDETKEDDISVNDNLRPIVIDGSNVAMSHGNKEYFSCKGIQLAVQYFLDRGHSDITVFVPIYRKEHSRPDAPIKDQEILSKLEADKILVFTPSRHVKGRRITCYDDRFIIKLAEATQGVIVSNDNFRDLQEERSDWRDLIEKRLLMYSFVSDRFMPPDDPLGKNGPSLDNFLRIRSQTEEKRKPECPYGKKCTYGKKCKYFHPEVPLGSVSERLIKRGERDGEAPISLAHNLAKEFISSGASSPKHGAAKDDGKQNSYKNQEEPLVASANQRLTRRTTSPCVLGAYGVSRSPPLAKNHAIPFTGISTDLQNMSISTPNPTPHSGGYIQQGYCGTGVQQGSRDSNVYSTGANGQNSNTIPQHMRPLAPPPLHNQYGDRRRGVASSATPQRTNSHLPQQMHHHSSPSAIPSYDVMEHQQGHMQPQYPVTYPSHPAQHPQHLPPPPPAPGTTSYPGYPLPSTRDMMMFHHHMMQQYMMMSQMQPGGAQPQLPPYMYPTMPSTQPSMMTTNHMVPQVRSQPMYGHHSSPPLMSAQLSTHGAKPPPDQVRMGFKDPSSPRYHLYKNLCGLFNKSTVEKILIIYPQENDAKRLAKLCLDVDN